MTVLGGKEFLKQGYPEAIVKVVFFCFCFFKIFINVDRGEGEGGRRHLLWNCPKTFDQDSGSLPACRIKERD